jgi:hypothetical protein
VSNLLVQDINQMKRDQSELAHSGNSAESSFSLDDYEKAKLLASAGFEAARLHPERVPLNRLVNDLASDGNGKKNAHSLILHSRSIGEPSDTVTLATNEYGEALDPWLAVQRPRVEILGGVLVMPNVTVTDSFGRVLIENGTSVDVFRVDESIVGLKELASSGKSVAEDITAKGRNIFSIEAVRPPVTIDENSSRVIAAFKRLSQKVALVELNYNPEIEEALGSIFGESSNPAYLSRDDIIGNKPSFGRILSTNPIDNTTSNR